MYHLGSIFFKKNNFLLTILISVAFLHHFFSYISIKMLNLKIMLYNREYEN